LRLWGQLLVRCFNQGNQKQIRSGGSSLTHMRGKVGIDRTDAQLAKRLAELCTGLVQIVQRRGDRAVGVMVDGGGVADDAIQKRMEKLRGPGHEKFLSES